MRNKIKHRQKVQDREISDTLGKISIGRWLGEPRQRTIEILLSDVGDFPVLHFLSVFDFISHFYQLF